MSRRERALVVGAVVIGAVLVAVGVWQSLTWDFSFGWFAYAPLSDTTFTPTIPNYWLPPALIGLGTLLVGLGVGFRLGRGRND
jgi:heme/copper-type cytochrome/quinol oxidase subunit 1